MVLKITNTQTYAKAGQQRDGPSGIPQFLAGWSSLPLDYFLSTHRVDFIH